MPLVVAPAQGTPQQPGTGTALVSVAQYRAYSGDSNTPDLKVQQLLIDAQRLVEEYLGRRLQSAQRTETLSVQSGVVYPTVTPVTAATLPMRSGGLAVDGYDYHFYGDPFPYAGAQATVTYTGGFTSTTLPMHLVKGIVDTAKALTDADATTSELIAGATNVRLGDASVTFGNDGASEVTDLAIPAKVQNSISPYKRRFV